MIKKSTIWFCKLLLRLVEFHKKGLVLYSGRLNTHLKALETGDFFIFCIETGYPESALKTQGNESEVKQDA